MAQLVLGVAGAAVGSLFGVPQLGWMIGVGLGSAFAPKQTYEAPQIEDTRFARVDLGQAIAWVAGSPQVSGNVIYASRKRPIKHTEEAGGKNSGGAESTYYTYEIDIAIKVSENPIVGVSRVWKNGALIFGNGVTRSGIWADMRVYKGEEGQTPDPDFEAAVGAAKAQAHLGCGAVFIKSLQLDSGGNMPVLKFEVGSTLERDYSAVKYLFQPTGVNPSFEDTSIYAHAYTTAGPAISVTGDGVVKVGGTNGFIKLANTFPAEGLENYVGDYMLEFDVKLAADRSGGTGYTWQLVRIGGLYLNIQLFGFTGVFDDDLVMSFDVAGTPDGGRRSWASMGLSTMAGRWATLSINKSGSQFEVQVDGFVFYEATLTTEQQNATVSIGSGPHVIGSFNGSDTSQLGFEIRNFRFTTRSMYAIGYDVSGRPLPLTNYWESAVFGFAVPEAVTDVVTRLMLRAGYTADQFDVTALAPIAKSVRGLAIGRLTNTRSVLELLAQTHWFTWQKRGFQIVFLPRVEDVAASIPFDDLGVSTSATSDRTPLEFQFASELELPAQVSVTYPNVLNDYQPDTQLSDHFLSQQQSVENIELAVGMTPTEAKAVADAIQIERLAAMGKASVTVPLKWLKIEPNDVVNLYDQTGREYRVRVGDVKDHGLYLEWDVVLDDVRATLSAGVTDGGNTGQSTVQQMALTEWLPLDMPLIRDADNNPGWWVAAAPGVGDLWPGAAVLGSWDGVSFSKLADTTDAAVFGETTTVLGDWTGGNVFDTTNSVTVSINGEASSYTRAAMLADLSLGVWLIGSEVIRARTATLVSAGVYRLSNLIRGFRGTAWAMGTHVVGERAVLINSALRRVATQQSHIGLERQIKAITAGLAQTTATAEAFTDTGIALKPFAPVNLKGAWDVGTGDLALTWRRHPRLSHRFLAPGIEPPLGETSELYDVEIWDTTFTTLKRTFASVTTPAQAYTAAQQTTDFGAPQSSVGVRVYQRSEAVGRGYKLQGVV